MRRVRARVVFVTAASIVAGPTFAAQINFDNGGATGLWETATNWQDNAGVTNDVLPGASDVAVIHPLSPNATVTASISSSQAVAEAIVSWPNGNAGTFTAGSQVTPAVSTLNVLPGASLIINGTPIASTSGFRIGRAGQAGALVGSSKGIIQQTGGLVRVDNGTNGFRLSQADAGVVGDSLYQISGGSIRGGATNGAMTAPLQIGGLATTYNRAEFHVVGSGVTEMRFEDVRMQANPTAGAGTREAVLHFSLDSGGVTPITVEDEMRFSGVSTVAGANKLEIDLIGLAPLTDIILVNADRIGANSAPAETFTGMPDGTPIQADFGTTRYHWNLRYTDGSDNGVIDANIRLQFVSTEVIPEPSALALLSLGGLTLVRRRSRSALV